MQTAHLVNRLSQCVHRDPAPVADGVDLGDGDIVVVLPPPHIDGGSGRGRESDPFLLHQVSFRKRARPAAEPHARDSSRRARTINVSSLRDGFRRVPALVMQQGRTRAAEHRTLGRPQRSRAHKNLRRHHARRHDVHIREQAPVPSAQLVRAEPPRRDRVTAEEGSIAPRQSCAIQRFSTTRCAHQSIFSLTDHRRDDRPRDCG